VEFFKFIAIVVAVVAACVLVLKPSANGLAKDSLATNGKPISAPFLRLMAVRLIIVTLLLYILIAPYHPFERGMYPKPDTQKGAAFVTLVFIVADTILDIIRRLKR